jgi:hypothetical protein
MSKAKFRTVKEYHGWCDSIITKIYYANIAMNDQLIADAVSKIASVLHLSEGQNLIDPARRTYRG